MTDSTQEKPEKSEEKAEAVENSITSTTESTTDFVEDWTIVDTLGEGSFGEVKLLLHKVTKEAVAVKIIDHSKHEDAALVVKKEVAIHRTLQHPNIIRYLGVRKDPVKEYIFLEYASGGELFDKIEPDMGMPMSEAQKYFKQLLSGVQYLHSRGIVHRDIKPENLLLDKKNDLKITDFGMATVFRMKGVERNLESRCGTLPYMAPEVVTAFYKGRPADIWSCGITLIAMLSGELPWDIASDENKEYKAWLEGKYMTVSPWRKIDNMPLSLCRSILAINPEARYTIDRINEHRWMRTDFNENKYERKQFNPASNKKRYIEYQDENIQVNTNTIIALSQPAPQNQVVAVERVNIQEHELQCFSQPTGLGDLLLNTGIQFSQSPIDKTNFEKLVSRMTRFFVTTDSVKTLELLVKHLQTKTTYNWNLNGSGTITIRTVDSRKNPLVFKAKILNMEHKILLDFRLSKGCGLEFKKRFLHLKNCLSSIILDD